MTVYAITNVRDNETREYEAIIVDGANTELHELPVSGSKYGLNLNKYRLRYEGTNEGCNRLDLLWNDAEGFYKKGQKDKAYFLVGVMLHMIQDMGVPAHAHKLYHQGTLTEHDTLEFLSTFKWEPQFEGSPQYDPHATLKLLPSEYYRLSKEWALKDSPGYKSRTTLPRAWILLTPEQKTFVLQRQGRTALMTEWALQRVVKIFRSMSIRQSSRPTS